MPSPKILLIENDPLTAEDIRHQLQDLGYTILAVEMSGHAALERIKTTEPDLVLVDIDLQDGMDGPQTAQLIHQERDLPIIFLSNKADEAFLRKAKKSHPFGFILKPIRDGVLSISIELALHNHRAEAHLRQALRQSEQRHRIISELTSDYDYTGVVHLDGTVLVDSVGPGFIRITGYELQELNDLGGWSLLIHPDDWPKAVVMQMKYLSGQRTEQELRILTKAQATRWIRYSCQPFFDPAQGRVTHILGAVQDITQRKQAEEKLQTYANRLLEVQEAERRHLARELHDEIGQILTAISMTLEKLKTGSSSTSLAKIDEGIAIVQNGIQQVRSMSLDLRPSILDDFGLPAAIRWFADRQSQLANFMLYLDLPTLVHRLPPQLETTCFRVVQEALTNVARHAHADNVWIKLDQDPDSINLSIRDDGVGFDPTTRAPTSFGLLSMQERVQLLNGQFLLHSTPGHGTTVQASLPAKTPV